MRHLVLSDVHADAAALERVLAHADGGWDRLLLLGDLVGYGSEPVPVVRRLRELQPAALVRGNHEAMMFAIRTGREPGAAPDIVRVLARHLEALQPDDLDWLARAPLRYAEGPDRRPLEAADAARAPGDEGTRPGLALAHGSPDERRPFAYVLSVPAARAAAPHAQRDLTFVGHSHVPGGFVRRDGRWAPIAARREEARFTLEPGVRAFLNPGSVSKARDGGPGGCYLIWDDERREATVRRVGR